MTTGFRKDVGFSAQEDEAAYSRMAAANRAMIGATGMLPETYGLSAEELSDLMNSFRAGGMGDAQVCQWMFAGQD